MSTYVNLYAEILSPDTGEWVYDDRFTSESSGSGWYALLGLTSIDTPDGKPFPGIATAGYPKDMSPATAEEMIAKVDLEAFGDGYFPDENTSFGWFTLADLDAIAASDAEFRTRRGATKASTLASFQPVIDKAIEHCETFFIKRENIRFVAAIS